MCRNSFEGTNHIQENSSMSGKKLSPTRATNQTLSICRLLFLLPCCQGWRGASMFLLIWACCKLIDTTVKSRKLYGWQPLLLWHFWNITSLLSWRRYRTRKPRCRTKCLQLKLKWDLARGECSSAKGPDMKGWNKGKGLTDVSVLLMPASNIQFSINRDSIGRLAIGRILLLIYCYISTGYNLRYTAESTSDIVHKGVLLVACGMWYKIYCANIGWTFIVDPNPVSLTLLSTPMDTF